MFVHRRPNQRAMTIIMPYWLISTKRSRWFVPYRNPDRPYTRIHPTAETGRATLFPPTLETCTEEPADDCERRPMVMDSCYGSHWRTVPAWTRALQMANRSCDRAERQWSPSPESSTTRHELIQELKVTTSFISDWCPWWDVTYFRCRFLVSHHTPMASKEEHVAAAAGRVFKMKETTISLWRLRRRQYCSHPQLVMRT